MFIIEFSVQFQNTPPSIEFSHTSLKGLSGSKVGAVEFPRLVLDLIGTSWLEGRANEDIPFPFITEFWSNYPLWS